LIGWEIIQDMFVFMKFLIFFTLNFFF
jgi:hypothetical protein